jgi:hypothetical protein
MKKLLLLLLAFPLMAVQCEADEDCNCEKKLYMYSPPMGSGGTISIPARYTYVRSIPNQCGETTTFYEPEYGSDYNRYKLDCD